MSDPTRGTVSPNDTTPTRRKDAAAPGRLTATRNRMQMPATTPKFSQPVRQIVLMVTVLALVLIGGVFAYGRILPIFLANRWLNGLILAVFAMGIMACFWQVAQLVRSVVWIEEFAARRSHALEKGVAPQAQGQAAGAPRLLAPLAALLGTRGPAGGVISTGSARSILESVGTRIEELRDITRYLANLLIFLGLLGTFYGLATTVPAVVETIRALAPQAGESGLDVFEKLMTGLEAQLGGMATAFSSSLLGLAGSLVVGLLELFVTHGQNRFYRELEEWMSDFTRVSLAASDGDGIDQAALAGFLDQLAGQMDRVQRFHADRDAARDESGIMADERVMVMAEAVEALLRRSESQLSAHDAQTARLDHALTRLADGQDRMLDLARQQTAPARAMDLTGIEDGLDRLVIQMNDKRDEMVAELRSDLLVLTRAVRAARFGDPFPDDRLDDAARAWRGTV